MPRPACVYVGPASLQPTLNTISLYGVVLEGGGTPETKTLSEEFEHNLHTHTNANIGTVTVKAVI